MNEPKLYYDIEQGSEIWLNARLGIVTASEVNIILTPKGKPAKGAKVNTYACEKAAQRETRILGEHFESYKMQMGHVQEVMARDIYSENYEEAIECGIITRKICGVTVGASPDGLVGADGGIEVKSRDPKFHVNTIITDEIDGEFMNQVQTFLLVSDRKWCDFISFSNGLPMYVKRVYPDLERQAEITNAIVGLESLIVKAQEKYRINSAGLIPTEWVDLNATEADITGSE